MLVRGQTTQERIAEIAQGLAKGIDSYSAGQRRYNEAAVSKERYDDAKSLQEEAKKRQEAIQALEVSNSLSEKTGKIVTPDMISPMFKTGDFTGLGEMLKSAPATQKSQQAKEDRVLDREFKQSQINKNNRAPTQKKETGNGIRLSPTEVQKFNEGNAIPMMLDDIAATIGNNEDIFGPVQGRLAALNPYNEKVKTAESQLVAAAQSVGKFLEGGVLRAEDVPKYRKMLPDLSDPPDVARNKLDNVRRLLINRQNSDVGALKGSGYDVKSIDKGLVAPGAPSILGGGDSVSNRQAAPSGGPKVGAVEDGYVFIGGDPGDPSSWQKARQ